MGKAIRVLLIEDNPGDASLIRGFLEMVSGQAFDVAHCTRLTDGLERARAEEFNVLLLDLQLPDSVGMETVHRVLAEVADMPVVILSGSDNEAVAIEAITLGIQDYLVKGNCDEKTIVRAVRYAMERKRLEAELRKSNETLEHRVTARTADLDKSVTALGQEILDHQRAEKELQESKQQFTDMCDAMPVVFWMATANLGQAVYANKSYEALIGRSREEMYHNPLSWLESVHPDDRKRVQLAIHAWVFGGGWRATPSLLLTYRILRPDGAAVTVRSRSFSVKEGGQLRYVCGLMELAESDTAQDQRAVLLDEQGHIAEIDPSAAEILGDSAKELLGHDIRELAEPHAKGWGRIFRRVTAE